MAGEKKKGLFGKLFRRKDEDQESAPRETEKVQKEPVASRPVQSERAKELPSEAPERPAGDLDVSDVPSVSGDKTDIVELEMDIPEDEISTVALSLDDLDAAAARSDVGRDAPGPGSKDDRSFADVQLETAEIEATTEIGLDNVELQTDLSIEADATEIPSHIDMVEPQAANGQATIPMSLEDMEADLAADDQDMVRGSDIDIDLDEDEEPALPAPFQAGGVRDERAEAAATVREEASITAQAATSEEPRTESEDQEIVIEEDEEPDFDITTEEEHIASTSRELAGRLGFPEHVTQDQPCLEPQGAAVESEQSPSLQEVSATAATVDVPSVQGLRDTPMRAPDQVKEGLGMQPHVSALSNFVRNCQTPLSISIQGDSGSGKTSLMSLVAADLDDSQYVTTWFSSRDYSRFSDTKEVPALLIRRVLHAVERNAAEDNVGIIGQMIDETLPLMNGLWKTGFFVEARGMATIEIDESADALAANGETDTIAGLQLKLREIVRQGLESGAKKRIVVFVDDMDRIDPPLALDLLETIGTFLAIDRCVFVIACSPGTIERGIRATSSSDGAADTSRSYFDRVFQLSVNTPARASQLRGFVTDLLGSASFDRSEETLNDILPLIHYSVGVNPRRIKHLANRLVFAGEMSPELCQDREGEPIPRYRNQKLLLALGCLDCEFGPVFRLLVNRRNDDKELMNFIDEQLRDDGQIRDLDKEYGLLGGTLKPEAGVDKLVAFMDLFSDLVHAGDRNKKFGQESIQLLKQAIDLISLTSIVPAAVSYGDAQRNALTEFCSRVRKRLNQILPDLAPDGSDKSIRSWPSPRPWFGLWYTDDVTKKVWGQRRLYYELSFDTASRNAVSVALKCNTSRLVDFGIDREVTDRLKSLPILRDNGFRVKEYDSGWLEIVKVLHECTCSHVDEVNNDEVESTAKEMKELVLATRDVFDPRPQLKVLRPDIQRLVKRQIPPCKVCGSELKQVTTSDGTTGFRCDKCRKIYKPKTTKPNG